jgi:hypothetical protein
MNTPILAREDETDALRGDLRACERSPRPIPCPEKRLNTQTEGRR